MLSTPQQRHACRLSLLAALLAGLALAGSPAPVVGARTFAVDRGDDPDPPAQTCTAAPNDCSLREAILAANVNPDADTISLPVGIYILSIGGDDDAAHKGDLDITSDVAIVGAGASATIIDANGLDRVFDVLGGSVSIANITIREGLAATNGGALYNRAGSSVTLTAGILQENAADAGGAIYNAGMLTLDKSTIIGNLAGYGGGIENIGTLRVTASAIINNTANATLVPTGGAGGGLYNNGVLGSAAALAVINSTISGNKATIDGGGIYNIQGTIHLDNATIAKNTADSDSNNSGDGGGIMRIPDAGQVFLRNTLVGGNADTGGQAPDCATRKGTQAASLASEGYNLVQNTATCTITGNISSNITGQDPKIGPLQNNGGPTLTHALLGGSPAIDAGNPAGCKDDLDNPLTTDQRSFTRPQGNRCDIGAYERALGLQPPFIVKAFAPAAISVGGRATLVFMITSVTTATLSGLAFNDQMPAAIKVAPDLPRPIQNTCGGTLNMPVGASTISLSGGSIGAGATCTIRLYVTSATPGIHANITGPVSTAETGAGAPSNTATLAVEQPPYRISLPMITK
jgi:hypothetical protein